MDKVRFLMTVGAAMPAMLWANAGEAATLFVYTNRNFENSGVLTAEFLVNERPDGSLGYTPSTGLLKASARFTADGVDYVFQNMETTLFNYYDNMSYSFELYDGPYADGVAVSKNPKFGDDAYVFRSNGYRNLASGGVMTRVSAVPEPLSWTMMILGFGMVGGLSRYRPRVRRVVWR